MTAVIEGVMVTGTPEEIAKIIEITKKQRPFGGDVTATPKQPVRSWADRQKEALERLGQHEPSKATFDETLTSYLSYGRLLCPNPTERLKYTYTPLVCY